jgi:hypothetical protein
MKPLHPTGPTRQSAQAFSERLGSLAAEFPSTQPAPTATQLNATPAPLPTRLFALLADFRQRAQRRQETAEKLRAEEFMRGCSGQPVPGFWDGVPSVDGR